MDDLADRVRVRLYSDLPRPHAVMIHPDDFHDVLKELWKQDPEWINPTLEAWNIPVRPMDGVPRGTYAWKLTPMDEARRLTI